ncbi:hypothetical protein SETIT_9G301100v2 [Setaria italica]|uniref:Uncharacterized protein n=1 Tax=Setaria italica TaxID=4555 RepID=A0A368SM99_SETIT|nr:hypothetical protein SETIT_9G301100v2 [Setaria italica]
MPSPAGDGVIKKLPRDWEAGARMVCVSTERSLLVCAPCMHTHTCMQRMPRKGIWIYYLLRIKVYTLNRLTRLVDHEHHPKTISLLLLFL